MAIVKDKKTPAATSEQQGNLKKPNEWKPEASNLQSGTATPYVALFSLEGGPIVNPLTGIALGAYVTEFKFSSGDENEDALRIVIDTGDPNAVDIPESQEKKELAVQWGYIYSNGTSKSSKVHVVEVKQLEVTFDDQGTHITVGAKDSVSDLRLTAPYKPSGDENYTMKNFLDDGMGLEKGIIIELFE